MAASLIKLYEIQQTRLDAEAICNRDPAFASAATSQKPLQVGTPAGRIHQRRPVAAATCAVLILHLHSVAIPLSPAAGLTVHAQDSYNGSAFGSGAAVVQDHENGYNGKLSGKNAIGAVWAFIIQKPTPVTTTLHQKKKSGCISTNQ
ncbi:MAG: hypothetical protein JSR71_13070 [Proteobacteria bacterium]|nr:hypothetical protein [Pseudomonadota bacterium]